MLCAQLVPRHTFLKGFKDDRASLLRAECSRTVAGRSLLPGTKRVMMLLVSKYVAEVLSLSAWLV